MVAEDVSPVMEVASTSNEITFAAFFKGDATPVDSWTKPDDDKKNEETTTDD